MKLTKLSSSEKGFTLIELLIVIVIIGILAGVLIAIIDPVRQQNRSKNATIKASLDKVSFAISTARAGIGRLPNRVLADGTFELEAELENIKEIECVGGGPASSVSYCTFKVSGVSFPDTCEGKDCYITFTPDPYDLDSIFKLTVKRFPLDDEDRKNGRLYYVFNPTAGFYECYNVGDAIDSASCVEVE
jgi:prepilin-type N-terminal cleavage/methylation domain-containing protein